MIVVVIVMVIVLVFVIVIVIVLVLAIVVVIVSARVLGWVSSASIDTTTFFTALVFVRLFAAGCVSHSCDCH